MIHNHNNDEDPLLLTLVFSFPTLEWTYIENCGVLQNETLLYTHQQDYYDGK